MADRSAGTVSAGLAAGILPSPRRELVLVAVVVIGLSRLAEGPALWAVGVLLASAVAVGARRVLADAERPPFAPGVPPEASLVPAVAAFASLGVLRLVPVGLAVVVGLVAAALLLDRTLATEARLASARRGPGDADRVRVLAEMVVVSFLAFLAAAALVPGGLPEPGGAGTPLSEGALLLLVGVDALVAGVLGYRAAALRVTGRWTAVASALTYASAVAIAAAALRAADIPRLVGPALLTLVFFLWDAFHGAPAARRRDPRWIWQVALLAALGLVVVAWNLALR